MPPLTRLGSQNLDEPSPIKNVDSDTDLSGLGDSIQVEMVEIERFNVKSKPKRQRRAPRQIPIRICKVPQQRFNTVYKNLTAGQPALATPVHTETKRTCNRMILSDLECYYAMQDGIHPESTTRLMIEMRNSVQRCDWVSLAKYITIFAEMARDKKRWYPTLLRYCMIALTEDRLVQGSGLLESFLEGVINCHTAEEKEEFLSVINDLPSNIHVSKYSDLWGIPEQDENLGHTTLQRLNDMLAKHADDDDTDDDEFTNCTWRLDETAKDESDDE